MPLTNVPAAGGSCSLKVSTEPAVTGDITLTAGTNITITQDTTGQTFTIANAGTTTTIAGTGTITPNASLGATFSTTVTGALTLNGPTSAVDGQKVMFRILNDASHSVTFATGAGNFRFGTDITSYTNSVSKTDYIGTIWNLAANRWDIVSVVQGF